MAHVTRSKAEQAQAKRTRRGFTLVELMVTMTGTLIISITLFSLAKFTTQVYQGESRISTATLSNVIGFERLRADITRAGSMSSPHVRRDPLVCGDPVADALWPAQLRQMTSIRIDETALNTLPTLFDDNDLAPQSLTLSGNFLTTAGFAVDQILLAGGNYQVILQTNQRVLAEWGYFRAGADRLAILESIFPAGRAVRIVDESGRHHYATISGVNILAGPTIVLLGSSPALQNGDTGAQGCGIDIGSDGLVRTEINPVQFIRYRIGSLSGEARFAPVYAAAIAGRGPDYEVTRTELIREELDVSGNVIEGTRELIAEYAVDLHFGVTVAPSLTTDLQYLSALADIQSYAGNPVGAGGISAGRGPQLIRTLHTTLSIRSLGADRITGIIANPVAGQARHRIGLGASGTAPFARLRTTQARIAITNHLRANWQ